VLYLNKQLYFCLLLAFLILLTSAMVTAQGLAIVNIGIIKDGNSPRFNNQVEVIKQEILEITRGEFDVRFPQQSQLTGDWDVALIRQSIDKLFNDNSIDLIIATGPVGSQEIISRKSLAKPAIATIILDIALQDAPLVRGTSGVKNLNYLASPKSFERDLKAFQEIVNFKHLSILVTDAIIERLPQLQQKAKDASVQYGIDFQLIPAGKSAVDALALISDLSEAVMVTPLVKMSEAEFLKLAEGLKARKLPSFSMHGRDEVELGLFASLAPSSDTSRVGRRIAINVLSILTGEDAGSLPVGFSMGERLVVNMETARAIDLYPNWSTLSEAERINEHRQPTDRSLNLATAVNEAISANLDLALANQEVAVGKHNITLARSALLPQIDSSLSAEAREAGLANINTPQRSGKGSFRLSQIVYSDSAWARLETSGKLQEALELERDSIRLDIILSASTTYLNILKAKTIEQIQKENVRRSRHNLELARVRESVGQSSRADVYRWESEIATDKQEALAAEAARLQAELNLNRLLNRPQDDLFTLEDATISDPLLLISDPRFFSYVENQKKWFVFHDFMAEQGINNAPELKAIDLSIEAQARNVTTAERQYWLPEFSIEGGYADTFSRGGTGSSLPAGVDDNGWNIGLSARLPLFSGGAKNANLSQQRDDFLRLHYSKRTTEEKIEARIRNALHDIGASYPSIELARKAADAAGNNLRLITDAYRAGSVSLIDLIDAQNAALSAELSAANAIYDFLLDLMEVQRATARFDFFLSPEQRQKWYQDIEAYYEKAK
jgi:outer membrane protein